MFSQSFSKNLLQGIKSLTVFANIPSNPLINKNDVSQLRGDSQKLRNDFEKCMTAVEK